VQRTMNDTKRRGPQSRPAVGALLAALLYAGLAACTSGGSSAIDTRTSSVTSTTVSSSPASKTTSAVTTAASTTSSVATESQSLTSSPPSTSKSATASKPTATSATTLEPTRRFTWAIDYSTTPKTAEAEAAIKAAMPAYIGYMTTYDDSLRNPNVKNWETVMSSYAADQALSVWRDAWQGHVKYGLTQKGTRTATGKVTSAAANGVTIRACMNVTNVDVVDEAGNAIRPESGSPTKGFAWLLTFKKENGRSRITANLAKTSTGKTFSC